MSIASRESSIGGFYFENAVSIYVCVRKREQVREKDGLIDRLRGRQRKMCVFYMILTYYIN